MIQPGHIDTTATYGFNGIVHRTNHNPLLAASQDDQSLAVVDHLSSWRNSTFNSPYCKSSNEDVKIFDSQFLASPFNDIGLYILCNFERKQKKKMAHASVDAWKHLQFAFPQLMLVLQEFSEHMNAPADAELSSEVTYWQYQELKFTLR